MGQRVFPGPFASCCALTDFARVTGRIPLSSSTPHSNSGGTISSGNSGGTISSGPVMMLQPSRSHAVQGSYSIDG
jgi:hypothetical protein